MQYLGLPLITKGLTSVDYLPLTEQLKRRIVSWTTRFLSFAGRFNLISSILWSLCNFWLAAFRLPRECIREIDKLCSTFLWSGLDLNPHKAKIAWYDVCKPKREGGLRQRSLKEANDVCILKLIWRIVSHGNSLWVRWLNTFLLKKGNFWSIKETTSLGFWMWKKIILFITVAKPFCKVDLKSGHNTSFWYNWFNIGSLMDVVGDRGVIDMGISKQMLVADAWQTRRRRAHRSILLYRIEDTLEVKRQSRNIELDIDLWRGKSDAYKTSFSTKDTWNLTRTASLMATWYKGFWFSHATPKFSFYVWLAAHNRLSTGDRMSRWNNGASGTSILLNNMVESRNHLFFSCVFSSEVWEVAAKKVFKRKISKDWQTLVSSVCGKWHDRVESFTARYVFQTCIYTLWRERNRRRHGEAPNTAAQLIVWIDK